MTSRRDFLTTSGLALAGLALGPLAGCRRGSEGGSAPTAPRTQSAEAARATPARGSLLTRAIPSTGEQVPVIGMGTSGSFEVSAGTPEYDALKQVLKVFFDGGGRLIDTSPNYGPADTVLGALLAEGGSRERCFLATKIAADDLASAKEQWAESLRRLKTDRVELLQVHNLRAWEIQLPYARELKAQGKTKYIGLTHYRENGHAELERIVRAEKPDFLQINYSVASPQAARSLFPMAQELGVAVLVNRAFEDGKLFAQVADRPLPGWAAEVGVDSWAQLFLKFAISHPAVTAVIPATGKPNRQADNLKGGTGPLLSEAQQTELISMFK
ncbi:aldo/keto reductase [Pyxidicoccus fallax]|uniref:Aldo/keto reductase n=1 Tax=Pyxidicoccus fallax TaxID=394095 RepID=A0A848LRQ8_9BACT|nr:aldo/keto reductase [Pyxidicoccus fallax]NMO20371.1 aldo/keto reductase [Pyxidicoccus fallax]NPC83771.1 aldo/keto reductase [Pyxidicoccus fallax]